MLAYRIIILLAVVMPVPTPCTNVCTLDARGSLCIGCGRTLDEIGRWSMMTYQERRTIMKRLKAARS